MRRVPLAPSVVLWWDHRQLHEITMMASVGYAPSHIANNLHLTESEVIDRLHRAYAHD